MSHRVATEERTRHWLEENYLRSLTCLGAEQPAAWDVEGQPARLTRYRFQEIQRKLKIFRWLERLDFESFLDVGSGFDIYPKLVQERYGVPAVFSDFVHAMNLPYGGAASGKLDRAVTLNAGRLPFDDAAFDMVLATEVLEHLVRPVEVIAELVRVSRRYVLMTSLEALSPSRRKRCRAHWHVDVRREHVERNFFLLEEFAALFGPVWFHENLFFDPHLPAPAHRPEGEQEAAYAALRDRESLAEALCHATAVDDHRPGAMGILLVKLKPGARVGPRRPENDRAVALWLIERAAEFERFVLATARSRLEGHVEITDSQRPIAPALVERLRCPDCRAPVESAGGGVRCTACGRSFPGEYGVPILYPHIPREGEEAMDESLRILCGGDRSRRRVVARLMGRLRRNERPPGILRQLLWRFW